MNGRGQGSGPGPVGRGRDVLGLVGFLLACFGVSALAVATTAPAMLEWYPSLRKPSWTPPAWVFGPVWTLLYVAIALSGWLVWRRPDVPGVRPAFALFRLQLALNAVWPGLFFGLRRPGWALVEILVLWGAILATLVASARVNRAAALLLLPYLAWVGFAAALTAAIWRLN